jgi:hypothetical protein
MAAVLQRTSPRQERCSPHTDGMMRTMSETALPTMCCTARQPDRHRICTIKNSMSACGALLEKGKESAERGAHLRCQHHERLYEKAILTSCRGQRSPCRAELRIADAFDALTTPRPHKYPLSPFYALQLLAREAVIPKGSCSPISKCWAMLNNPH